jgi:hypothetical protein
VRASIGYNQTIVIPRPIAEITREDIDRLTLIPRIEDRQIDYKLELPGQSDDDKREFLADIVAFANTAGGDLVFGVEEAAGVPTSIRGVAIADFDALRLRLQDLIRDAIDPRIPAVEVTAVDGYERGPVVVLRVHQSWNAPHMVTFKRWSRFFARDAGQRHQMDVLELREAFVAAERAFQQVRGFRDTRIKKIVERDAPVMLHRHPMAVIHVLPLGLSFSSRRLDPRDVQPHVRGLFSEDFVYSGNIRFNLDGLLVASNALPNAPTDAYIQVFRDGGVEAVATFSVVNEPSSTIYGNQFEGAIVRFTESVGTFRQNLRLEAPCVVSVALLEVMGVSLEANRAMGRRFDRELVSLPETVLLEFEKVATALRPTIDTMWQAAGWQGSPNYNEAGDWSLPR